MKTYDDHYRVFSVEPMHFALENNLDAAQQTLIKYIIRDKDDRLEDLMKARDLLDDYISYIETGKWKGKKMHSDAIKVVNEGTPYQDEVNWRTQ